MTLGTNASIKELMEYAPSEINFDLILEELKELEEWRELLEEDEYYAADVGQRLMDLETEVKDKDETIEDLRDQIADLEGKVYSLECALEPRPNQA